MSEETGGIIEDVSHTERGGRSVYCFTSTLHHLLKDNGAEFARQVQAMLDAYLAEWAEGTPPATPTLSAIIAGRMIQIADKCLQESFSPERAPKISCASGCAHCCHMHVGITQAEGDLLVRFVEAKGIRIDTAKLARQLGYGDTPEGWAVQPEGERRCVFLSAENTCQVYEVRPLSCRKYSVMTPPALCQIQSGGTRTGVVALYYDLDVEILTTAAFTFFAVGSLPMMVEAALRRRVDELAAGPARGEA